MDSKNSLTPAHQHEQNEMNPTHDANTEAQHKDIATNKQISSQTWSEFDKMVPSNGRRCSMPILIAEGIEVIEVVGRVDCVDERECVETQHLQQVRLALRRGRRQGADGHCMQQGVVQVKHQS